MGKGKRAGRGSRFACQTKSCTNAPATWGNTKVWKGAYGMQVRGTRRWQVTKNNNKRQVMAGVGKAQTNQIHHVCNKTWRQWYALGGRSCCTAARMLLHTGNQPVGTPGGTAWHERSCSVKGTRQQETGSPQAQVTTFGNRGSVVRLSVVKHR